MTPLDFDRLATLADVPGYHRRERPEQIAFTFEGRETTFAEFDRHTDQVAAALRRDGVRAGRRIAYLGKNSDHYFELLFGAAKAGAVMTPLGGRLSPGEIAHMLQNAEAALVFVGPEVIDRLGEALAGRDGNAPKVVAMEAGDHGLPLYEPWREAAGAAAPTAAARPEDVAIQLYTSGTTGRPKGAMLTHRNLLALRRIWAEAAMDWNTWGPDDVSLVAMPVAHIGGTGWGLVGLLNGAKGVIAREFDPLKVLDLIERDRISKLFMVPAALQIVIRQPRAREVDYSSLKHILYGASPMPLPLLRDCMAVFGCGFVQQYGMTETCGTIVYLPPEDHDPAGAPRMRAAGVPMPGVEIKIVDAAGEALPANTVGEVATRSLANMAGYWRLPDATAEVIDAEGWLRTGDAGYLDEDGYLFIHDRVKDMIISGGENIYPAEVENALYDHPAVAEAAVIGTPDETWGEAVTAIVVLKPGTRPDAGEILSFVRRRIAAFKVPKRVEFVEVLPRNASGKVLRRMLREPYWADRERRVN